MRVAVKYCGGCNARYDRTALVERLKSALGGGTDWMSAAQAEPARPDFVLVVCGCTAACAGHRQLTGRYGKLVLWAPEQEEAALRRLRALRDEEYGEAPTRKEAFEDGLESPV